MNILKEPLHAIILAAGKGTRMKSQKAKVLHEVFFAPMVEHVVENVLPLDVDNIVVVTGHQNKEVEKQLKRYPVKFAQQVKQTGTANAVLASKNLLEQKKGTALILCGDTPLITTETLTRMIESHTQSHATVTVMTTILEEPDNYGRIISNEKGEIARIVEEKDATSSEKLIEEVNTGIYCVELSFLFEALAKIGTDNKQGEFYLTDIVSIATSSNLTVEKYVCQDSSETIGVNSRLELAEASKVLQIRRNRQLMQQGVTIIDPETVYVSHRSSIGIDTILHSHVYITGESTIGQECVIKPFVNIENGVIASQATISSFTNINGKGID